VVRYGETRSSQAIDEDSKLIHKNGKTITPTAPKKLFGAALKQIVIINIFVSE
jgi:hypothetical protein